MKIRQSVYLDTSVINFLFADDSPEKKEITKDFFDNFIRTGIYNCYISGFVIDEIENNTDQEDKKKLLKVIEDYPIDFLEPVNTDEISYLANVNRERRVISANLEIGYINEFRIITPLELMDYEN